MFPDGSQDRGSLQLTIAGIGINLTWEGAPVVPEPGLKFFHGFLFDGDSQRPQGPSEVRLHLHCGRLPSVQPEAVVFDAVKRNHWRAFRANGPFSDRYVFEFFLPRAPHPRIQLAALATDFRSGVVYRRPDRTFPRGSWSLSRLMRPFGELLLVKLLSQGRGVLVHGLGVVDGGAGVLFVGRSGAGKSTLANLYKVHRDVTILGDERVAVTGAGGQFWLAGTPWPGDGLTTSPDTVPLRKIFFLEHGTLNEILPDSFSTLYGLFFQQIFLPFWDGKALAFAARFAEEMLKAVPAHRLAFVNDARVIGFLREQGAYGPATKD